MELIKKFAKEISVFGIVLVVFLGLFAYRQATFKDYKTVTQTQVTKMVEDGKDFVIVVGNSTDSTLYGYQSVMTEYTTANRSTPLYYLDIKDVEDSDKYIEETFKVNVTYPATFIVKDGKVTAKREGAMQYYSLYDFIKENFK